MSIVAYTGLPGSGKTYSVVEHQILPALKAGRTVVTNVPLHEDVLTGMGLPGRVVEFPVETVSAEPHRIRDFVTAGCVFVLDEVWRIFPQGQQANKVPEDFKSLLAEHRHMVDDKGESTQIVFVVQDLANIGAFARRLVENTFVTTKLGFVGMSGRYRVDVFHGAQTGATPPISNRLRMIGPSAYRKDIFKLYKSHTMAARDDQVGANEAKLDGRANILKRPAFIVGAVVCPLLVAYSLHLFGKAFHGGLGPKHAPANSSGPAEPRSGAERPVGMVAGGAVAPVVLSTPRLLLQVEHRGGELGGFIQDGPRLVEVRGDDCRRIIGGEAQCRLRGHWYDRYGDADLPVAAGPTGPYTSARSAGSVPSAQLAPSAVSGSGPRPVVAAATSLGRP